MVSPLIVITKATASFLVGILPILAKDAPRPHLYNFYSVVLVCAFWDSNFQVWTHNIGIGTLVYMIEQICDSSGEDPSCCRYSLPLPLPLSFSLSLRLILYHPFQRSVSGDSITDHTKYLGIDMQADTWGSCRIVMDYSVLQYQMDLAGNIVVSKRPVSPSIIQPITQEDDTRRSNVQD